MPPASQRNQFFDRALQTVRALPGVESAAWIDTLPLQGGSTQYVMVDGMPPMKESEMPVVAVRLSSPGYFHTARIPLRAGRDFGEADGYGKPRVVIVSENTAKRFWPGENPLGKRITLTMMTKEAAEVVGVVREVKTGSLDASEADSETAIYAPAAQFVTLPQRRRRQLFYFCTPPWRAGTSSAAVASRSACAGTRARRSDASHAFVDSSRNSWEHQRSNST